MCEEANMTCIVFPAFTLEPGLNVASADLLIRLSPGFPDVPPDMWWFSPAVSRLDGRPIPATEHVEMHLGRIWQRWSRHLSPGQWQSGTDCLETFLAMIRREIHSSAQPELVN
ncbi:E2/UBC family protein [Variovorax paradoxus]|uniref:E2/UBC family protein n=1 Tax=Variovorax paradoxus TaxID=34073 RepID=UPI003F513789